MKVSAIFALTTLNNSDSMAFGHNGDLICRSREDLQHFKKITYGSPIIMGRKTFDSMGHKALPGRTSIIISGMSDDKWNSPLHCIKVPDLDSAITHCKDELNANRCFVIGGAGILIDAINRYADEFYLTTFDALVPGADVTFSTVNIDWTEWQGQVLRNDQLACIVNKQTQQIDTSFELYTRKKHAKEN